MKKLNALLLSLVMCLSLAAVPAQAAFIPDDPKPDGPIIIDITGDPTDPKDPDNDPDDPENPVQPMRLPGERDEVPVD